MLGPIFYDQRQSIPDVDSMSPSAGKPARFNALVNHHYYSITRLPVQPVTREDLCLVHDRDYVDGVFDLDLENGFGNRYPRVPEACLWTAGSLVSATLYAPTDALAVCSPTSGFHHAGHDFGGGFCTFNGLMVAAARYLQLHPSAKVGILDCDVHNGNGTDDILARIPWLRERVVHHTSGKYFQGDADPDEFFLWLDEVIGDLNAQQVDVTIYQAGADMHIDDPLGGFLDDAQMRQRDRTVFRKLRGGLVWNLAGGYRGGETIFNDPVLQTHLATMGEANASDGARRRMFGKQGRQRAS
ncbi:hypothetical protein [Rhodoferax sediminis]|uniref:Histone deacetylase domain-containing protein n=1 Tax=Rhodoferax sediminis TaxID=2509614 RepID=A0A515D9X4_9BURK|nr:hypothetical protein [Rhodoferax sediminis]QDL37208.1 hypothetical protein EUB48_07845 [Rhodoferax sediminis]